MLEIYWYPYDLCKYCGLSLNWETIQSYDTEDINKIKLISVSNITILHENFLNIFMGEKGQIK